MLRFCWAIKKKGVGRCCAGLISDELKKFLRNKESERKTASRELVEAQLSPLKVVPIIEIVFNLIVTTLTYHYKSFQVSNDKRWVKLIIN